METWKCGNATISYFRIAVLHMSLSTMQKLEVLQWKCDGVFSFVVWFSYKTVHNTYMSMAVLIP